MVLLDQLSNFRQYMGLVNQRLKVWLHLSGSPDLPYSHQPKMRPAIILLRSRRGIDGLIGATGWYVLL